MRALLDELLQGDTHAVNLCMAVFEWANLYDHLIDGDAAVAGDPKRALHDAMWLMAVVIPQNPFYRAFQPELSVSLANGISSWRVANELQTSDEARALVLAHVLRWFPIEFFLHCARLLHGAEWAAARGAWFWTEMTRGHGFEEFVSSVKGV